MSLGVGCSGAVSSADAFFGISSNLDIDRVEAAEQRMRTEMSNAAAMDESRGVEFDGGECGFTFGVNTFLFFYGIGF